MRSCVLHDSKLIRLVRLRPIVSILLVISHHWVCFVQTYFSLISMKLLAVLLTLSIHNIYSSIADARLCVSSFLSEVVSTRDSRQSFLGHDTFTKAELVDIMNNICTT